MELEYIIIHADGVISTFKDGEWEEKRDVWLGDGSIKEGDKLYRVSLEGTAVVKWDNA